MALSYYSSNWDALQDLNSDVINNELLDFNNDLLLTDTSIDPLFQSNPSAPFYPDSYNYNALNSELLLPRECYNYCSDYQQGLFCGHIQNPSMCQDFSSVMVPPLPDFATALSVYSSGSSENLAKKPSGGSLSAQSIAARQRRRRITEKTQELGKLVPGGQKMNTAEMLQAAYKYIKYLQAQVGILEFIGSYEEKTGRRFLGEELHELLESSLMQEKLYSKEKCLVPQEFVQALANDREIKPQLEELKQLM